LWLQGWDKAPWHINKVKESWQKYNSEWNIELVSEDNLSKYINIKLPNNITPQAKSDIIRLNLLYEHGGVWADATMLCLMPLDLWLFEVIQPSSFWMYHGRDNCTGPASWFII
jgi:mannosyltransferase OCH1-like enzyme